ncbi:MAG: O-antigen ligase family protein [Candidatus Omnitrophica bacterium]|nr:O-antigen ligase family protein [Candidatus Omnitrophota bacterium]
MTEKVYKNILLLGFGAVMVFAPLAKAAVQVWSVSVIELLVFTLIFTWLWRVNNYNLEFRKTPLDTPIWLFLALCIISAMFSIYKYGSFYELLRLSAMMAVFYLAVNNFDRQMTVKLAVLVIIVATAMSLLGLGQYFFGLDHSWWKPQDMLAATYVNHNHFAGYLELAIPMAIAVAIALKNTNYTRFKVRLWQIGLGLSIVILLAAFVFSQSRGAWLSLTISLFIMNLLLVKRKILKKESIFIFALILILAVAYIYGGHDDIAERLRTVKKINEQYFSEVRQKIWLGTVNMIKSNPLKGTGIGTFVWGLPKYRPEGLMGVRAHYAHNDYLQWMAEMGIMALPLVLWVFCVVIGEALDRKREFGLKQGIVLGAGIGILSLAIHGLVDFNFHITANMLVVAFYAGIIMRGANKGKAREQSC